MIQTIKLPYTTSIDNLQIINEYRRQGSIVYRYAFNRFQDGLKEKEIRQKVKELKNINDLDSWFIQSSIKESEFLYLSKGKNKVVFGGKSIFNKWINHKIEKEELKKKRLNQLISIGESPQKGNRKFTLDIIENNKIIFKPKRGIKINLNLPKLRKNYKWNLSRLQEFAEDKKLPFMIKLDDKFVYISFDFGNEITKKSEGKYLGIDLNPNYIGYSIFNKDQKLLKSGCFNLSNLTQRSYKASSDKKSKYLENKLNFETIEISKFISNLCKQENISFVFIEKLNFENSKVSFRGFNRLCKNKWKRNLFINNLKKRLEINAIKLFEVNAAYSSFIGNLTFNLPDPISASCEIARRGYNVIIKKNKQFYPEFKFEDHWADRWKKKFDGKAESWIELFSWIKNSKLKYRVPFSNENVFRIFMTEKSNISYTFNRSVI